MCRVLTQTITVHSKNKTSSPVIAEVHFNDELLVKSEKKDWLQVEVDTTMLNSFSGHQTMITELGWIQHKKRSQVFAEKFVGGASEPPPAGFDDADMPPPPPAPPPPDDDFGPPPPDDDFGGPPGGMGPPPDDDFGGPPPQVDLDLPPEEPHPAGKLCHHKHARTWSSSLGDRQPFGLYLPCVPLCAPRKVSLRWRCAADMPPADNLGLPPDEPHADEYDDKRAPKKSNSAKHASRAM